MLHIDTAASTATSPTWDRIGKSTILDITMNAQTEENDFIEDEMASTDIMSYKPEIPEELQCNKGDPAFDHLYKMFKERPTGEAVKRTILLTWAGNVGTDSNVYFDAWKCQATITLDHFDAVAEKIYFSIAINKVTVGYTTVGTGGAVTFSETTPTPPTP